MSYIQTSDSQLTKSLWLSDQGDLIGEPTTADDADQQWQLVPKSFEECCEWAFLYKSQNTSDRSRPYHLFYKLPDSTDGIYTVSLRLQGFVKKCSLGPLGTWTGSRDTAAGATQTLVLASGGCLQPWSATLKAVRDIRQLIHNGIPSRTAYVEPEIDIHRDLYLRRRIFTKVPAHGERPLHVLRMDDDPEYLCGQVSNEWVVKDKLAIGRKIDGGKYIRCSPLIIGNGDFVDIAVEMDIASTRNANGVVANRVHLSMQHVIQLVNAQDVATYRQTAEGVLGPTAVTGPVIRHATIDFGEIGEEDEDLESMQELHI